MSQIRYMPNHPLHRHYTTLKLGELYSVKYFGRTRLCQFIKPTPCGYNLLELETHKCILPRHVYPSKKENHINTGQLWFYMNTSFMNHITTVLRSNTQTP